LDAPGTLHHVIIRGIEKKQIVKSDADREDFVRLLGEKADATGTTVYAWSLMTNHAHILLKSGKIGISGMMRKLLTSYAVRHNLRNRRHGHLFQNRYKSIICEEDPYFLQLVRYIHLNPLRAGLVKSIRELDGYRWSGHSAIMGNQKYDWQDTGRVLMMFGGGGAKGRDKYREYILGGVNDGRNPGLVGGGLIRSMGGWSEVLSARRRGDRERYDDRILGGNEFVTEVLKESGERVKSRLTRQSDTGLIEMVIRKECKRLGTTVLVLRRGGRRLDVVRARESIARRLVMEDGISLAEVARRLGVSTSGVANMLRRTRCR
jgi:REP element-mobilizing transposase RayT